MWIIKEFFNSIQWMNTIVYYQHLISIFSNFFIIYKTNRLTRNNNKGLVVAFNNKGLPAI